MRLGKSLLAIRWVLRRCKDEHIDRPRILLISPTTPIDGWTEELTKEKRPYLVVHGGRQSRLAQIRQDQEWTIINYEAVLHTKEIRDIKWDAVILDESTRIKNPQSKTYKFINRLRPRFRSVLSGLPAPQSYFELWTQMAWVHGGRWMGFGNFWKWRDSIATRCGYSWEIFDPRKLAAIKRQYHAEAYVLTRAEAGLANEKIKQKRTGFLGSDARKLYRQIVRDWEVPGIEAKHSIVITGWLRRLSSGFGPEGPMDCWKYDELVRLLEEELSGEQVVVWFAYNAELARVWRLLRDHDISTTWIAGAVPRRERGERARKFRDGRARVFLGQVACGKYGLDLRTSDTTIYFSHPDSYEARAQSEDRIESMQKKTPLLYIDFITKNTADEDAVEAISDHRFDAAYLSRKIQQNRRTG